MQRYRGQFGTSLEHVVSGFLEVEDNGAVTVELLDEVDGLGFDDTTKTIFSEIAESTLSGSCVTLFECFCLHHRYGTGGPFQRWKARRALFGDDHLEPQRLFKRITLEIDGLDEFMSHTVSSLIHLGPTRLEWPPGDGEEVASLHHNDHKIRFRWRYMGRSEQHAISMTRAAVIEVELRTGCTIEDLLSRIVPVYEGLLTVALRRHAKVRAVRVANDAAAGSFDVMIPRVGHDDAKPVRPHELVFRFTNAAELSTWVTAMHRLFDQMPDFAAVFLAYERAPSQYVEDRFRAAFTSLFYILRGTSPSTIQANGFEPPCEFTDVPRVATDAANGPLKAILGDTADTFAQRITNAYRWTHFRDVAPISGRELLNTGLHLRMVLHFLLLQRLGFTKDDAAKRLIEAAAMRGL